MLKMDHMIPRFMKMGNCTQVVRINTERGMMIMEIQSYSFLALSSSILFVNVLNIYVIQATFV